ncbi:hypothetical protein ABW20_dc0107287 [Dactylellina cionopaga]|nr:hypothetical protein ABW20_dc0107287 [Dactylellina cionopaga]
MASDVGVALLDHIIVLLPHSELLDPPKWLTDNFNVTNGGKHADGKTENKLIILQDGTYIELISFIDDLPENREGHWWGKKPYGIVDWAFTTGTDYNAHHTAVVSRLDHLQDQKQPSERKGRYSYAPPQTGGRIRPDGVRLEWAVTFPTYLENDNDPITRPLNLPFFCHDITPRENRVNGATEHPCGATGIREVRISVDETSAEEFAGYIGAAVNSSEKEVVEKGKIVVGAPHGSGSCIVFVSFDSKIEGGHDNQYSFRLKDLILDVSKDSEKYTFTFSYSKV